jgi:hypothetical protein
VRARTETVGARLKDRDQVAFLRLIELHAIGEQVEGCAQRPTTEACSRGPTPMRFATSTG